MNTKEKTILLVEDEAIIAYDQAEILKRDGYNVITALTGEEAIEIFNSGKLIDLILMDVDLGKGMDGTQAADIILRDRDIPLIFLSNHTEKEFVEKTDGITSYGYVVKNAGENVLSTAIKMAFKLHQAYRNILKKSQSLHESESRYRRLFESAKDGIFILNAVNGKIIDVNPYLSDLIGYTYNDLIGKCLWEISPLQDIAGNKEKFLELQRHEYVHYENLPLLTNRGRVVDVEFVSNIYLVDDEKVIQCNVRNIGERKIIEETKKIELEGKVTMLRELQHRVKNSLSIIMGLINLESNRLTDPSMKEILLNIRNRVNSIAHLYDLLRSSQKMKEIQLDQYIETMVCFLVESYSNKKNKIDLQLHLDKLEIDVDIAIPVSLILNELISNSLKYAFPDGCNGWVRIFLERKNDDVIIEVSDNGIGVPSGFTIEDSKGLGMTLIHMLSKQIKGSVENIIIDKGTLFRIQFPLTSSIA